MLSFLFVILFLTPYYILLGSFFNVSGCRLRPLETGVGALVSVGVAVVDARAIPCSGCTTLVNISVCSTPGSVPVPSYLLESFYKFLVVQEGRDELGLG